MEPFDIAQRVFDGLLPTARRIARETGSTLIAGELRRTVFEIVMDASNPAKTIREGRERVLAHLEGSGWTEELSA